jgi:LPS export ABC transporter permease LptF
MIFHRTLLREMTGTALATFLVLLGIVLTTQLVRFLALAAGGSITSGSVVALLGFTLIGFLPTLLSLTLFIAVLMTLSRAYRDSEMVVWFSCGVGLTRWISPVLIFALPLVLTIAALALGLSPWAAGKAEDYRKILDSRDDASAIQAGVFRESRQADRVFFVESASTTDNRVNNVFVSSTQQGRSGVMVAKEGYQETAPNGDRFLVMRNGYRYEGEPGRADFRIYEFERYAVRIETQEAVRASSGGAVVAHRSPGERAVAGVAGDSVVVRQSARGPLGQSYRRGTDLHGVCEHDFGGAGVHRAVAVATDARIGGAAFGGAGVADADVLPAAERVLLQTAGSPPLTT